MKNIKFGSLLPIPAAPVNILLRIAQRIEEAGFDSIWVADHLLMLPPGLVPEGMSVLTGAISATGKARLGCVTDIHRYHPAVLAQRLGTLEHMSRGRMILGLGIGEAQSLDPFGIQWRRRPLAKLRECVSLVRKLWNGEVVSFESDFFNFSEAFLQITPFQRVPIYIAANAPKSREVAGELGDGWLPAIETPETIRKGMDDVRKGMEKSNRKIEDFEVCLWAYTAIAGKREEALKALDPVKPVIGMWPKKINDAGFNVKLPGKYSSMYYTTTTLRPTEEGIDEFYELGQYVPKEYVQATSIVGTVNDAIEKIQSFIKAGVTYFILTNVGPKPKEVTNTYRKEIIPYFKDTDVQK